MSERLIIPIDIVIDAEDNNLVTQMSHFQRDVVNVGSTLTKISKQIDTAVLGAGSGGSRGGLMPIGMGRGRGPVTQAPKPRPAPTPKPTPTPSPRPLGPRLNPNGPDMWRPRGDSSPPGYYGTSGSGFGRPPVMNQEAPPSLGRQSSSGPEDLFGSDRLPVSNLPVEDNPIMKQIKSNNQILLNGGGL